MTIIILLFFFFFFFKQKTAYEMSLRDWSSDVCSSDLHAAGDNLSFFSGHATLAFALATSAGTVASMRHHRLAPVMWAVGLLLATTGGYLRIAADRHYATDVLTGALVGSAVGI